MEVKNVSLVDKLPYSSNETGYRINLRDDGEIWFQFGSGESSNEISSGSDFYSIGDELNIVGVLRNSNILELYVNNILIASDETLRTYNNNSPFEIGRWDTSIYGTSEYFNGNID